MHPFDEQIYVYSKVQKPSAQVLNCANTCANAQVRKYQMLAQVLTYKVHKHASTVCKYASAQVPSKQVLAQVCKYMRKYARVQKYVYTCATAHLHTYALSHVLAQAFLHA